MMGTMRTPRLLTALLALALGAGTVVAAVGTPSAPAAAATLPARAPLDLTGDGRSDVLALSSSGQPVPLRGRRRQGTSSRAARLGPGWGAYDLVRVVGDWDGNGTADVMARAPRHRWPVVLARPRGRHAVERPPGRHRLGRHRASWSRQATGTGTGRPTCSARGRPTVRCGSTRARARDASATARQVGSGWSGRDLMTSAGDWDGDGGTDVVSRETSTGRLWLNRGDGRGGFATSRVIGSGWGSMDALTGSADADGDRRSDLHARSSDGRLLLYRGDGTGGFAGSRVVGTGWGAMVAIAGAGVRRDPDAARVLVLGPRASTPPCWSGCGTATAPGARWRPPTCATCRSPTTASTAGRAPASSWCTARRRPRRRRCSPGCTRRASRCSGCSWSTPTAATTTRRWPRTTPRRTTAAPSRAAPGWSEHAYGTALDLNPVQNPYVTSSTVLPPAGRSYLDRSNDRPGMVVRGDVVVRSFAAQGWEWGGDWSSLKDYQHFSASGR